MVDEATRANRDSRYKRLLIQETASWRKRMAEWVLAAMDGKASLDGKRIPEVVVTLAAGLRECADTHACAAAMDRVKSDEIRDLPESEPVEEPAPKPKPKAKRVADTHESARKEIAKELMGLTVAELRARSIEAGCASYGNKEVLVQRLAKVLVDTAVENAARARG